jgi:hypothetical protein
MDQGLEIASIVSQRRLEPARLSFVKIEGETAALAILSTPNRLESRCARKNSLACSTHLHCAQLL